MADTFSRKATVRSEGSALLYALLLLAGLAMLAVGVLEYRRDPNEKTFLAAGFLGILIPAALYPLVAGRRQPAEPPKAALDEGTLALLRSINDRLLLSDMAKRIAYRQQDSEAMRKAIREDIEKGDYDAALALATQIGETYGYREEAEHFREEILIARHEETERKIGEALVAWEKLVAEKHWDQAMRDAARMQRLYPDSPRVNGLRERVRTALEQHKQDLERRFLDAAERDDVELAMELIKELDKYLTPAEAEPFRETARGVIGKKRQNLGVQFKLAVHDKEWSAAVRVGEQIIREFPNSRMADEVRGRLDRLRDMANSEQTARTA